MQYKRPGHNVTWGTVGASGPEPPHSGLSKLLISSRYKRSDENSEPPVAPSWSSAADTKLITPSNQC